MSTTLAHDHRVSVFSLASGQRLVQRICEHLGIAPALHEERTFEDGEQKLRPLESVRGRDVYLVESLHGDSVLSVNDKLVRVLFFLAALRDAGARRLTCIAPYLCYARKDQRTKARDPVSSRYVARALEAMGIDRVVSIDVHNPAAFENSFRVSAELLTATPLLVPAFAPLIGERPAVVVSPDAGGVKRAEAFRRALERHMGRPVGFAFIEKFRSEGVVRGGMVAGDIERRVAIVLDDLISSGTTTARAAAACHERGALAVYAGATHGVFSDDASRVLSESALERVVVLDTISPPRLDPALRHERIEILDCAPLLAKAVHRLHTDGSLTALTDATS